MKILFYIEILATLFSLMGVYLAARNNVSTWPIGMIGVALLGYIFSETGLYAEAVLQVIYFFISLYGWWKWKSLDNGEQAKHYFHIPPSLLGSLLLIWLLSSSVFGYFLSQIQSSALPYLDTAMATGGILITWMMAKKYIAHWICWIVIDFSNIGIFLYKQLYITAFLYFCFGLMAIYGYQHWKKTLIAASSA
ncbi:MAG: nicotinamide riboside transporter PnuC [Flavobacteriales bacterium]